MWEYAGLGLVGFTAVLMVIFTLVQRRQPATFRIIPAFARLRHAIGLAVEQGTRAHFSAGRGSLVTTEAAAAFAGLAVLRQISEQVSVSDSPPVATAGDGALAVLLHDTLSAAYESAAALERFDPTSARATGLTPFSYAAGVLPIVRDEQVSANILAGYFGVEAALITDAADRENTFTLSATGNVPAQAVLFASNADNLIGEELFAAGAYVNAGPMHAASLRTQDVLRWLIILAVLAGVALKLAGVL